MYIKKGQIWTKTFTIETIGWIVEVGKAMRLAAEWLCVNRHQSIEDPFVWRRLSNILVV